MDSKTVTMPSAGAPRTTPVDRSAGAGQEPIRQKVDAVAVVPQAEQAPQEGQSVDKQQLAEAVSHLNSYVQNHRRNLEFNIDESSGKTVVKVIDAETDEVIRQIPNENALHMAQFLRENGGASEGAILNTEA